MSCQLWRETQPITETRARVKAELRSRVRRAIEDAQRRGQSWEEIEHHFTQTIHRLQGEEVN